MILAIEFERSDWVFAGGFDGWINAEEYTDDNRNGASDGEDFPRNMWRERSNE